MLKEYNFTVDFIEGIFDSDKELEFVRGDNNSHKFKFVFLNEIENGTSVLLKIKTDKIYETAITVTDKKAEYLIPASVLNADKMQISIVYVGRNNEILTNYAIKSGIRIKGGLNSGEEPTQEEISAILSLTARVNQLKTDIDEVKLEISNAEVTRIEAENIRISNENNRKQAEIARVNAENVRIQRETERQANEITRANAENNRENTEQGRVNAENLRTQNENARIQNETERETAEEERKTNEIARQNAEIARNEAIQAIQEDIKAIQSDNSEQDEEITAMKETIAEQSRVIALHEKNAKKAYVEPSTHITVHDAAEMDAKIGVHGTSTQKVTEQSENLFCDVFEKYTTPFDYTIMPIKLEQGQSYKLKAELIAGKEKITTLAVGIAKSGDRFSNFAGQFNCVDVDGNANETTITVNDTYTDPKLVVYCWNATKNRKETFDLLFTNYNIGLTKGSEDKPYTPYVPDSPSTAFPSKINRCGDNINMFDETVLGQYADTQTEEEYKFASGALYNKNLLPVGTTFEEKTAYTLQYVGKQTTGNPRFVFNYTDGTVSEKQISTEYSKIVLVSNPRKTVQNIGVNYGSGGQFLLKKGSIQLEKGSRATKVRKYNCGTVNIVACTDNLVDVNELYEAMRTINNNTTKVTENDRQCIKFISSAFNRHKLIKGRFKEKTKYTIRGEFKRINGSDDLLRDLYINVIYTDGTAYGVQHDSKEWINFRLVTDANKTVDYVTFSYANEANWLLDMDSFYVGEGNVTQYSTYQGETVTFPLAQGQRLMQGDYPAGDGIHHVRTQKTTNISSITTLNNGNVGGVCSTPNKIYKTSNCLVCSNAKFDKNRTFLEGTVYENEGNVIFVGNSTDTLETLKEKYDGGVVEYELEKEEIEPYTAEQQAAYNKLQKLTLCKGTNNIFCIDEVPAKVDMTYTVATDMLVDKLAEDIAEIKSMLTTTAESEAN